MPFYYNKRKKRYRPYNTYNKALSIAQTALSEATHEIKNYDFPWTNNSGSNPITITAPYIACLTNIAQGDTENDRNGTEITLQDILIRLDIVTNSTATAQTLRIITLIDKQTNKALPAFSDIVENSSEVTSPLNRDNRMRFHILIDKLISLNGIDNYSACPKFYRKLNIKQMWADSGGTIASITTNSIIIVICNNLGSTSDSPHITGYSRVKFTDH